MNNLIEVRHSQIAGVGVFATQFIEKGQFVYEMNGERMDFESAANKVSEGDEAASDLFQIGEALFIDLEETSRSFNHACEPNVFVRGKTELVATRNIEKGEEITFDYSTTMLYDLEKFEKSGHQPWTCVCLCGVKKCRGIIDEFRNLSAAQQAIYIDNKWLPDFMLKHFAKP
jgi:uncharacterized protein